MGTESGLLLLDRSGQGKVYPLINRRRFQQMDVLEGLNVLVTISGQIQNRPVFYCLYIGKKMDTSFCGNAFLIFFNLFFIFTTGKKNKLRVYYLSWLRNKILHNDPEVEKKQGWTTVGELEGCVHYKVGMCSFKVPGSKVSWVIIEMCLKLQFYLMFVSDS